MCGTVTSSVSGVLSLVIFTVIHCSATCGPTDITPAVSPKSDPPVADPS